MAAKEYIAYAGEAFTIEWYETRKIVISNAFEKKSQKLPPSEKQRALKARSDYRSRVKAKTYY